MQCYLCNDEISEHNHSLEHIIPNSIGGRLKSRSLICKQCNEITGRLIDREFAKVGNILASKYNIVRESGIVQTIAAKDFVTGENLLISPGYKIDYADPKSKVTKDMVSVLHHDKRRAIQEIKRLIKENDGVEANENEIEWTIERQDENKQKKFIIDYAVEPNLLLRSVCKTLINFYIYSQHNPEYISSVINFLEEDIDNTFCWFLDLKVSNAFHNNAPYHSIIIKSDKKSKAIYGYFEIFGEMGFICLMSGKYGEEDFQLNYTFDPVNLLEIKYDYDFSLKVDDIIKHLLAKPESEYLKIIQL